MGLFTRGAMRGNALFLGLFTLANIFVSQFGTNRLENVWWIDLSFMPPWMATSASLVFGLVLIGFAVWPNMDMVRKAVTIGLCVIFAIYALANSYFYYVAYAQKTVDPAIPFPLSLLIAGILILTAVLMQRMCNQSQQPSEVVVAAVCFAFGLALFPLAQMAFFGTTDYRAPADVAVVFGARVYPDLRLSTTVEDRMNTAIELYKDGLVPRILLTGGVDADGVDETEGMKNYAIEHGVGVGDLIIDNEGVNTDASVANTALIITEEGFDTVLAVSQFYHLPRIKMAYRAKRMNVRTVPAPASRPIPQTPAFMAREIPAFWMYWLRGGYRDLRDNNKPTVEKSIFDLVNPFFG